MSLLLASLPPYSKREEAPKVEALTVMLSRKTLVMKTNQSSFHPEINVIQKLRTKPNLSRRLSRLAQHHQATGAVSPFARGTGSQLGIDPVLLGSWSADYRKKRKASMVTS